MLIATKMHFSVQKLKYCLLQDTEEQGTEIQNLNLNGLCLKKNIKLGLYDLSNLAYIQSI